MRSSARRVRRQSFTLVEVIAVLLVIAILAAVAAPKFVSLANEARNGVAMAGINEAKASLSVGYVKAYLRNNGTQPSMALVLTSAGLGSNPVLFGDIGVNLDVNGETSVEITALNVRGVEVTNVNDTWLKPPN